MVVRVSENKVSGLWSRESGLGEQLATQESPRGGTIMVSALLVDKPMQWWPTDEYLAV